LSEKNDTVLKVSQSNAKTRFLRHSYCDALEILLLWRAYTDEEIEVFQEKIDDFFLYVEQSGAGKKGITNYLHMLGSRYRKYCLSKFKQIFFYHTQCDGNVERILKKCNVFSKIHL
jgi:hypothetical protein